MLSLKHKDEDLKIEDLKMILLETRCKKTVLEQLE